MRHYLSFLLCFATMSTLCATESKESKDIKIVTTKLETGTLVMGEVLKAVPEMAKLKPSNRVPANLIGKIITLGSESYEIRTASFEDTTGKLPSNVTFLQYITQNNLSSMKSSVVHPLPVLNFESFDCRAANLKDEIYFSFVFRKISN